jgi:1-acyl-sn-glycerol-3-phosphate acyltransferase
VTETSTPAAQRRPGDEARTRYGPLTGPATVAYRAVVGLIRLVAVAIGRVKIVGAEKMPAEGAFVLAPVHRSYVDFALTALVTKRTMKYMGKDAIWKSKPLGRFVSWIGAFPVHRGTADREALRACQRMLESGQPVVVFPEGTRRSGPVVENLFDGPAYLASRTGVPIVPVGIGGSEHMMPKGSKFPRPTRLVLVVGDPIDPPARTEKGRVPRSAVHDLTIRLQGELQRLFESATALAGPKGAAPAVSSPRPEADRRP